MFNFKKNKEKLYLTYGVPLVSIPIEDKNKNESFFIEKSENNIIKLNMQEGEKWIEFFVPKSCENEKELETLMEKGLIFSGETINDLMDNLLFLTPIRNGISTLATKPISDNEAKRVLSVPSKYAIRYGTIEVPLTKMQHLIWLSSNGKTTLNEIRERHKIEIDCLYKNLVLMRWNAMIYFKG